jgi:hypothetical protein
MSVVLRFGNPGLVAAERYRTGYTDFIIIIMFINIDLKVWSNLRELTVFNLESLILRLEQ